MPRLSVASALGLLLVACGTPAGRRGATGQPPREQPATPAVQAPSPAPPPVPHRDVLLAHARALREEGDLAGARDLLEAGVAAAPQDDELRIELADLLVADGRDLVRAETLLSSVADPGAPRLPLVLARLAEARGDDARAALEYDRALGHGDDPDLRFRRALALERLGRLEEATAELERVRQARPEDAVARGRLADRYEAAGRMAEAEAELLLLAEAGRPGDWERLARFYERTGRPREARAAAERARAAAGTQERALRPLPRSRR